MNSTTSKLDLQHHKVDKTTKHEKTKNICNVISPHKEPLTDFEHVQNALAHFDHLNDESDTERELVFLNILKAANYFGINADKIDFHKQN